MQAGQNQGGLRAALSKIFRGKYLDFLVAVHRDGELRLKAAGVNDSHEFGCLKTALRSHDWVVYSKAPFAGAGQVLAYLGRYTHKTAEEDAERHDTDSEEFSELHRFNDELARPTSSSASSNDPPTPSAVPSVVVITHFRCRW